MTATEMLNSVDLLRDDLVKLLHDPLLKKFFDLVRTQQTNLMYELAQKPDASILLKPEIDHLEMVCKRAAIEAHEDIINLPRTLLSQLDEEEKAEGTEPTKEKESENG